MLRRYTASSAPVQDFLQVLAELDAADQRRFLRFVTGSPRLPPGGLSALQPRCICPPIRASQSLCLPVSLPMPAVLDIRRLGTSARCEFGGVLSPWMLAFGELAAVLVVPRNLFRF